MKPAQLAPAIIIPLIAWRMYLRVRRNIGRQPLQPRRMAARIVIFSLVTAVIAFGGLAYPPVLLGLACGLVLGVPIALLGLRLTQFEFTPTGTFYTPNTALGLSLSALFVGRIVYRFIVLAQGAAYNPTAPEIFHSPLTLSIYGLTAGYYIAYYAGVLRRVRAQR